MKFNKNLELLNSVYKNNSWWLFDGCSFRVVVENNPSSLDIKTIEFYYKRKIFVGVRELFRQGRFKKIVNNGITEVVGLSICTEPKYYLFELHKFTGSDGIPCVALICLDALELFDYACLLNCLLFNRRRQPLISVFSEREREILYFIMYGKTYGEIARLLSNINGRDISASSVGKIVRGSLYSKFNVWTKFELRQSILRSDLVYQIPLSILKYQMGNVLNRRNHNAKWLY